jgi:hypothetical protein
MSAHEKARRGFSPGRNFGVSISLIDGFVDHVNDFDPPTRVSFEAVVRSLSSDWADDQASRGGSTRGSDLPLALQLPFCFEVRALSDRLVSSTPE